MDIKPTQPEHEASPAQTKHKGAGTNAQSAHNLDTVDSCSNASACIERFSLILSLADLFAGDGIAACVVLT